MLNIKQVVFFFFFLLASYSFGQKEQLIVFVSEEQSNFSKDFADNYLPAIKSWTEEDDIELKIISITEGTPQEIRFTPAIYFQNIFGRSLFIGRYNSLSKIQSFVRKVRRHPQKTVVNLKEHVLVWEEGKAHIVAPLKITPLVNDSEIQFRTDFSHELEIAMLPYWNNFVVKKKVELQKSDRLFYVDVHPYLSESNNLTLSLAVFSQFNCINPVFTNYDIPISGPFKKKDALLKKLVKLVEETINIQLSSVANGDGFTPLKNEVQEVTWEKLGIESNFQATNQINNSTDFPVNRKWQVKGQVDKKIPLLLFGFPPPLDYYSGEVNSLSGEIDLSKEEGIGKMEVDLLQLTMGEKSLDQSIAKMLLVQKFPKAYYTIHSFSQLENEQYVFSGDLEFMGVKKEMSIQAEMSPVLKDLMVVDASFFITIDGHYELDRPDGPSPANNTINFYLLFYLEAMD